MVAIKPLLLLLATTAYASVLPLDPSQADYEIIKADLINLDNAVLGLKQAITNFNSGLIESLPILAGVTAVHLANRKGYVDAMAATQNETLANSNLIVQQVNDTLAQHIPASVKILIGKKAAVEAAGIGEVTVASLKLLKDDHDTFSAALAARSDPGAQAGVTYVVKVIDDSLANGIAVFSS